MPLTYFVFNDTATSKIYTYLHTLSLHDALPICAVILLAVSTCLDLPPPSLLAVFASEFLDAQRLRLRVAFVTLRISVLVEPDLGGRIQCVAFSVLMAFFEEQKVRLDSGIRIEDAVRQADDGVQVALRHQLLLDARLDAFAK